MGGSSGECARHVLRGTVRPIVAASSAAHYTALPRQQTQKERRKASLANSRSCLMATAPQLPNSTRSLLALLVGRLRTCRPARLRIPDKAASAASREPSQKGWRLMQHTVQHTMPHTVQHTMHHTMHHTMQHTMCQTKHHTMRHTIDHTMKHTMQHTLYHTWIAAATTECGQPYSYGLYGHGLYSYGLCNCGLYSYGQCGISSRG